ncbi:hypothetical protein Pve01_35250 [Planomonospora venezuelensis]|nr:hypothetical protein Pve01_35250 [Planomonospora venezuelensis]
MPEQAGTAATQGKPRVPVLPAAAGTGTPAPPPTRPLPVNRTAPGDILEASARALIRA